MNYAALAASQQDEELKTYPQREFGLQLKKIEVPGIGMVVWCDTVTY